MRILSKRWPLAAILCFSTSLSIASPQFDPDAGAEALVVPERGVVAGAAADPDCDVIGVFGSPFSGGSRYRGNVYRFAFDARLKEIKMELAFSGVTNLTVAIHRKEADGTYKRFVPDVIIPNASGSGPTVPKFFTTADAIPSMPEVALEAGFDYAIAFAWGATSITYGRDSQIYPLPFRAGEVLGAVAANSLPPPPSQLVPETFPEFQIFTGGAYSMQLCFEPEPGACCSTSFPDGCDEVLLSECDGTRDFFHGEHTLCAETPCIFGACCFDCGQCIDAYTNESCTADGGVEFWSGVTCPAVNADLCPPITGACCKSNGTCVEVCQQLCDGVYRGDGTTCSPTNPCKGACCIPNFGCIDTTQANCTAFLGTFRQLGTSCATLSGTNECGGACCYGTSSLTNCQFVQQRAFCAYDFFPRTAYRGDTMGCPSPNCGSIDSYRACCLPDGTCINVPRANPERCTDDPGVNGVYHDGARCENLSGGCPVEACCLPNGGCTPLTDVGCASRGGSSPAGNPTSCGVSTCSTGACCFTEDGVCTIKTADACASAGGTYSVNGTNCQNPASVCPGIGACCRSDGDCFDAMSSSQCDVIGGVYEGDGTVCDAPKVECDQRGACCAITGACLFITEDQCTDPAVRGEFTEVGERCLSNTCLSGACCLPDGCQTRTPADCLDSDGDFQGIAVDCDSDLCNVGACCNGETCSSQTRHICEREGGTYLGDGVVCEASTCALGACCQGATCSQLQELSCSKQNGIFLGEGVTCVTGICNVGACCNGETCSSLPRIICEQDGGTYVADGAACGVDTCIAGACCDGIACSLRIRSSCEGGGHVFRGSGTTCDTPNVCPCTVDAQCDDGDECTPNDRCAKGVCINDWHKGHAEFSQLVSCLAGPAQPVSSGCECYDLDRDDDVDLQDVGEFFDGFSLP